MRALEACQLFYNPYIHFLASGDGLAPHGSWRETSPKFLVPVQALSTVFSARVRDLLHARQPELFAAIPASVWRQPWVVHSEPVGAGEHALGYLARYIFRCRHPKFQNYRPRRRRLAPTARCP